MELTLTAEQQQFMDFAKQGRNVLVDACIGSGKTTAIQRVCAELPEEGRILYLTYNRRLLLEARARIQQSNVDVHTYHSFAGTHLAAIGRKDITMRESPAAFKELVQKIPEYTTIVVDEYQDLERDLGKMLLHIAVILHRQTGHTPQFLVVGDLDQKIYDYTRFDAGGFVKWFMDHLDGGWEQVTFSTCFRLPPGHAATIGNAWHKSILGANPDCIVRVESDLARLIHHLSHVEPKNLLVLGSNAGTRSTIQNSLEEMAPKVFNKDTVYSSIQGADSALRSVDTSQAAIFTTYDSAKGLERDVCVVCNFTDRYLDSRCKYSTSKTILRNLFLVAASRGKREIIFYVPNKQFPLKFSRLGELVGTSTLDTGAEEIDAAFDYRRHEDLDACLAQLRVQPVRSPGTPLQASVSDGMIDLGPCWSEYALARFFSKSNIDYSVAEAERDLERMRDAELEDFGPVLHLPDYDTEWPLWKKVLYLTANRTAQERYFVQITRPFADHNSEKAIMDRMRTVFRGDEDVGIPCQVVFRDLVFPDTELREKDMFGSADVSKNGELFKVIFAPQISHERRISAAVTCVATGAPYITVWNLYDDAMEQISVPDEEAFLSAVCGCVTNGFPASGIVRLPDTEPMKVYPVELAQPGTKRHTPAKRAKGAKKAKRM